MRAYAADNGLHSIEQIALSVSSDTPQFDSTIGHCYDIQRNDGYRIATAVFVCGCSV